MQLLNEISAKSLRVIDEIICTIMPLHEKNITHGSEFLDDAIRMKDQPYLNFESDETSCR